VRWHLQDAAHVARFGLSVGAVAGLVFGALFGVFTRWRFPDTSLAFTLSGAGLGCGLTLLTVAVATLLSSVSVAKTAS
jgi:hypothetical protein